MKCEWCGKNYPEELQSGEVFWQLQVYDTIHTICDDCFYRLKRKVSITRLKAENE